MALLVIAYLLHFMEDPLVQSQLALEFICTFEASVPSLLPGFAHKSH